MARLRLGLLLGVVLLSVGCVDGCAPSLYPFYSKDRLVDIPEAIGTWTNSEGARCVVSAPQELGYHVACEGETSQAAAASNFVAHFMKVDDQLFVDLFPDPDSDSADESVERLLTVPIHVLARIHFEAGAVRLEYLSAKWVEARVENEPDSIAHQRLEQGATSDILLTGNSDELRLLLRRAIADETAFSNFDEYQRVDD